jgi:hypothetical protein
MADDLKVPSFTKLKKEAKEKGKGVIDYTPVPAETKPVYVPLTDSQIEACRKGQDIFAFARDIEEVVRINNKI